MMLIIKNKRKIIFIVSLLGFLTSFYLTLLSLMGKNLQCGLDGCDKVLQSSYSYLFDLPISLLGIIYFSLVLIFNYFRKEFYLKFLSIPASFFACYLLYLQFFILKALCPFCLIADLSAIFIMFISFL